MGNKCIVFNFCPLIKDKVFPLQCKTSKSFIKRNLIKIFSFKIRETADDLQPSMNHFAKIMSLNCLNSPHYLSVEVLVCTCLRLLEKKIKEIFIFLLGKHLNKHEKKSEQWRTIKTESPQREFHERIFLERSMGASCLLCNSLKIPLQQSASLTQNTYMFPLCSQL